VVRGGEYGDRTAPERNLLLDSATGIGYAKQRRKSNTEIQVEYGSVFETS